LFREIEKSKQSKLVIEKICDLYSDLIRQGIVPMMMDDAELAQFIRLLEQPSRPSPMVDFFSAVGPLIIRFSAGILFALPINPITGKLS